jgi:oxalate decarboxylase/phosphoglucose isomerase-like protein (cupin superfamily)
MHTITRAIFPALQGLSIQSIHLEKGGIREPHFHPNASQLDFNVSGKARVGVVGPENQINILTLEQGDIAFVPQGNLHWIENIGEDPLHFMLTLSHEQPETIELSELMSNVPKDTLSSSLGIPKEILDKIPSKSI